MVRTSAPATPTLTPAQSALVSCDHLIARVDDLQGAVQAFENAGFTVREPVGCPRRSVAQLALASPSSSSAVLRGGRANWLTDAQVKRGGKHADGLTENALIVLPGSLNPARTALTAQATSSTSS